MILRKGSTLSWEELDYQNYSRMQGYSNTDKGMISWNSRNQALVLLSTTESKYIAMTHATKEALWMRMFLGEILHPLTKLMLLYCDNQSAIAMAKNNQYHAHSKHIDIHYHFIWEMVACDIVEICYCPTNQLITDIFTKALPVKNFEALQELLGVHLDWGRVLVFAMQVHIPRLPGWLRCLGAGNQWLQHICVSIRQSQM